MMKITNNFNLPEGFEKAVLTERHNKPGCISATTLIQGIKQIVLTERHWEELEDDVADRVWAIWGAAVHSLLEHEGENDFTEQEMSYKVENISVTGRIDNYNMATGTVCDYKTASVNKVKFKDFNDWYLQGMIYACLLTRNNFRVERCRFIALLKDYSRTEARYDYQYPQKPVFIYEFQVMAEKLFKISAFIRNKVGEYRKCMNLPDDGIPSCLPEERWEKATKYAVMKTGGKRAIRLLDNKEAVDTMTAELGEGHYTEIRLGESIKCQSFCLCCEFCNYYRDHVKPVTGKAAA
jgi:hypothetical protein